MKLLATILLSLVVFVSVSECQNQETWRACRNLAKKYVDTPRIIYGIPLERDTEKKLKISNCVGSAGSYSFDLKITAIYNEGQALFDCEGIKGTIAATDEKE